jgi:phage terminase small subunit
MKQAIFVKELIKTNNGTQAAMKAYDTKNAKTAGVMSAENLAKPSVREAVDEALKTNGLTLESISKEIGSLSVAQVQKVTADTKLKANVELLKLLGAYPDKKTAHLNISLKGNIKEMDYKGAKKELERLRSQTDNLTTDVDTP